MVKTIVILDTNVIINLYFVCEDFPEILDYLKTLKNGYEMTLVTTSVVVGEIDDRKHKKQKEFFESRLREIVDVISVSEEDLDEFKRMYGLYDMGKGEISALIVLKRIIEKIDSSHKILLLTADKDDVLDQRLELKELLELPNNVDITHTMFLYYLMHWLGLYDEEKLKEILFSSNRDLRIRLKDLKEYEKEFEEVYENFFTRT